MDRATHRRRVFVKVRIAVWSVLLVASCALYVIDRPLFNDVAVPFLLVVSLVTPIESNLAALAADS